MSQVHGVLVDAGNDQVVACVCGEFRGKADGADVPWSFWQVVTFRNTKALRIAWFINRTEGLDAAGLSEA